MRIDKGFDTDEKLQFLSSNAQDFIEEGSYIMTVCDGRIPEQ